MVPVKPSNKLSWIRTNQALGVVLSLFILGLVTYILLSPWATHSQRDGFLLGFMPLGAACLMLLLSFAIIFDKNKYKDAREESEAKMPANGSSLMYALLLLVMMALYFVSVLGVGYLLATPLFLFLGAYGLGARPWSLVLFASVLITLLIFLLLTLLGTNLPSGVLLE